MIATRDIEGKREALSTAFPWPVQNPKPLDAMLSDAIDAVASASSQGYITEAEAEVLFREILAAWASQSIMELVDPVLLENSSALETASDVKSLLHLV